MKPTRYLTSTVHYAIKNSLIPLWRGVRGVAIRLADNGLRQGCVISPLLYLLILDTIPGMHNVHDMPEWDNDFMYQVFDNGFAGDTAVVDFLILVFVDDTIMLSKIVGHMQEQLNSYHTFTTKWRIRVNVTKSAIIPVSKHCTINSENGRDMWNINGKSVPVKDKHKYLGVLLSSGNATNDIIKQRGAIIVQSKAKVKSVKHMTGINMAQMYIEGR